MLIADVNCSCVLTLSSEDASIAFSKPLQKVLLRHHDGGTQQALSLKTSPTIESGTQSFQ
jgi:hypothetical protein